MPGIASSLHLRIHTDAQLQRWRTMGMTPTEEDALFDKDLHWQWRGKGASAAAGRTSWVSMGVFQADTAPCKLLRRIAVHAAMGTARGRMEYLCDAWVMRRDRERGWIKCHGAGNGTYMQKTRKTTPRHTAARCAFSASRAC